jgi:filamentous hemagglutinin family protein
MIDLGTRSFGQHRRRHAARAALFLATTAMTSPFLIATAGAQSLPTGASVAAGNVTIAQPSATRLDITQTSHSAVVNWQGFSVGQGSSVNIAQPNASSALLNRVTGNTQSTIAGQVNANGQVYLVNPNGIAITKSGVVNTGGGFVASTLGISDSDFMAGKRGFTGNGASANVSNEGAIRVGRGGYAALIGGTVSNAGSIEVPLGKVGLGSGEQATLDFSGDGFLQVAIPTKAGGNDALVKNSGSIKADGGSVIISAATAREAARNAVNISGTVQARSISGHNGSITIGGGEGGNVRITGNLNATSRVAKGGKIKVTGRKIKLKGATVDASGATGGGTINIGGGRQGKGGLQHAETTTIDAATTIKADAGQKGDGGEVVVWSDDLTSFAGTISARGGALSGNGGEAEVSGKAMLAYTGFTDLSAFHGAFGTLLLDPYNVTISSGPDTGGFTASGNDSVINAATLEAALGGANVTVSTGGVGSPGAQAGNITVAAPVAWSSGALLTLDAANAIAINANITVAGGGQLALNTATTTIGSLTQPLLSFGDGASATFAPGQSGQALSINGNPYTLLYTMADLDGIDGSLSVWGGTINAQANGLSGRYALAGDLDATGTIYTAAPIGATFSGTLTGLGHSITDLTISAPGANNIGLVSISSGTLRDIGLIGGSVSGFSSVGGLVGTNDGAITQAYATGSVSETGVGNNSYYGASIGGLVGTNNGTITQAYATGGVTGFGLSVGGLVGANTGSGVITQAYATGAVLNEESWVGGLVGLNAGMISQVYATGAVYGWYTDGDALVGIGSAPADGYWNTQTSGTLDHGIGIGLTTAQLQSGALPSGFDPTVWGAGAGLYP